MARVFRRGWDDRTARYKPACIAGPIDELLRLASQGLRLEHSVIAFTYEGEGGLSNEDREALWNGFGVPVFEQYLDRQNRLLATECDAHSGLHVVAGCSDYALDTEVCGCGNRSPRLSRGSRVEELVELLA